MFGNVTDLRQHHHPQNIPHLLQKTKGFPPKAKSFQNTATYQKLKGGAIPPSPLYNGGRMRVRPRVKFQ